jgi:hypothetical protein
VVVVVVVVVVVLLLLLLWLPCCHLAPLAELVQDCQCLPQGRLHQSLHPVRRGQALLPQLLLWRRQQRRRQQR